MENTTQKQDVERLVESLSGNSSTRGGSQDLIDTFGRLIDLYWSRLTRQPSATHILEALRDSKTEGVPVLYVPEDPLSLEFYREIAGKAPDSVTVKILDKNICPNRSAELKNGLLATEVAKSSSGEIFARPYVVPGGRFNEIYGWDSYFIVRGLLASNRVELAKATVQNQMYQVEHYGKVLNANRSYFLSRSQPPLLLFAGLEVAKHLDGQELLEWGQRLTKCVVAEYINHWSTEPKRTSNGLSRYYDPVQRLCPGTEEGHYHHYLEPFAAKYKVSVGELENSIRAGLIDDDELTEFLMHDGAMRESGHDSSWRTVGKAAQLNSVLLNSLLYAIEVKIAEIIDNAPWYFSGPRETEDARFWHESALSRRRKMNELMWCDENGAFYDYDFVQGEKLQYSTPNMMLPLWAGLATPEQAARTIDLVKTRLLAPGGLLASDESSKKSFSQTDVQLQWDHPFGWAPHQVFAWDAAGRYGHEDFRQDAMFRWALLVGKEVVTGGGTIAEKYDVLSRTCKVQSEYGNEGAYQGAIDGGSGFGWTNASFIYALKHLKPELLGTLSKECRN